MEAKVPAFVYRSNGAYEKIDLLDQTTIDLHGISLKFSPRKSGIAETGNAGKVSGVGYVLSSGGNMPRGMKLCWCVCVGTLLIVGLF